MSFETSMGSADFGETPKPTVIVRMVEDEVIEARTHGIAEGARANACTPWVCF